ncbi:carboxypeptidase D isoform X1 [Ixodes scapularis]|uniref:carboxypeptidase D isoform X1 n=1 Tax=Ixodes scapularis TaxID=6945 RepID=UPI001AD6DC25|nr:carboxypeptidase D isoform X1 [Ixodes scapularis]
MRPSNWCASALVLTCVLLYLSAVKHVRGQSTGGKKREEYSYYNHEEMTAFLRKVSTNYPDFTRLYSVGKSVQNRDLWVLLITKEPHEETLLKPNVKYVANMHGNEAVGRQLMVYLIAHLLTRYNTDAYVRYLLDNTRIHIMPSMNPDGYEISKEGACTGTLGRYNARGVDLNRNFPDHFKTQTESEQPETTAVRRWIHQIPFVLSGNIHGGAVVASYPFDNSPNAVFHQYNKPSLTPDDDVFKQIASVYSFNHANMYLGAPCSSDRQSFPNGTTNGAAWYPLAGGMQDYNYVWEGCMEVTFEISCCKYPLRRELPRFWEDNKQSLLAFLGEAHKGVRGIVSDEENNPVVKAFLKISNRSIGFKTTSRGEYWRILRPGRYTLEVSAPGFHTSKQDFIVLDQQISILNVTLKSLQPPTDTSVELTRPQQPVSLPSAPPTTVPTDPTKPESLRLDYPAVPPPRQLFNGFKAQPFPNGFKAQPFPTDNGFELSPFQHH